MYFPGDPLFALDPIYQCDRRPGRARAARRDVRPRRHPARVVHRLPLGHRAHRRAPHPARGGRGGERAVTPHPHARARPSGPFFGYALPFDARHELVPPGRPDAVRLHGRVLDGAGDPVPDAILELWQADADGHVVQEAGLAAPRRVHLHRLGPRVDRPTRAATASRRCTPGAPFFALTVFARGLLNRLFTRAYLPEARGRPVPRDVDAERRGTLVAARDEHGFVFDIHLQGERRDRLPHLPATLTADGPELLFWPGDHRADEHFSDETFREAMLAVEMVWLDVLVDAGIAPPTRGPTCSGLVEDYHDEWLTEETEAGGNPVDGPGRAAAQRARGRAADRRRRGCTAASPARTSLDTALMLMAQDAVAQLQVEIRGQAERLAVLATTHRGTAMVARTLTQHAVPTTFGLKAAQWLAGVLDAYDDLDGAHLPRADRRRGRHPRGGRRARRQTPGAGRPGGPAPRASRRPRRGTPAAPPSPGSATRWSGAPTPGAGSPRTCSRCRRPGDRRAQRGRPAVARRRCRTSTTRSCPC